LKWALRVGGVAGVALVAVVYRDELVRALVEAPRVGWRAALLLPLFCIWTLAAAAGWRAVLRAMGHPAGLVRLALIRLQSQAVNVAVPLASIPGEVLKSSLVAGGGVGLWRGASSVFLDTLTSFIAGLLFTLLGLALHWTPGLVSIGGAMAVASLALVLGLALYLLPAAAGWAARWRAAREPDRDDTPQRSLDALLHQLEQNGPGLRRALQLCTLWHLAERLLTAGEIWIAASGLDVLLGPGDALFATAAMTGMTLVFFFVPAQLGAAEGGLSLAFGALGFSRTSGLSVSLVRRGRQLLVTLAGLALLGVRRGQASASPAEGEVPEPGGRGAPPGLSVVAQRHHPPGPG
jgi:hypothetical protein